MTPAPEFVPTDPLLEPPDTSLRERALYRINIGSYCLEVHSIEPLAGCALVSLTVEPPGDVAAHYASGGLLAGRSTKAIPEGTGSAVPVGEACLRFYSYRAGRRSHYRNRMDDTWAKRHPLRLKIENAVQAPAIAPLLLHSSPLVVATDSGGLFRGFRLSHEIEPKETYAEGCDAQARS
jgi:hypothetical protein